MPWRVFRIVTHDGNTAESLASNLARMMATTFFPARLHALLIRCFGCESRR
jgi:hypothetical protein